MKKLTAFLVGFAFSSIAYSQKEIKLEEVSNHIGDSVKVCGKILTGRYLDRSESGPTLLNMGKPYPDQLLTVVIYKKDRQNFDITPEVELINKDVCVSGVIVIYKEKPQMVLYSKEQLTVNK